MTVSSLRSSNPLAALVGNALCVLKMMCLASGWGFFLLFWAGQGVYVGAGCNAFPLVLLHPSSNKDKLWYHMYM